MCQNMRYVVFGFYLVTAPCFYAQAQINFIKEPKNKVAVVGQRNLTIECKATSTTKGDLSVVWKHNDSWITDYKDKHFKLINGSLYFIHFLARDVGKYQCAVILSIQDKQVDQKSSRIANIQAAFIETNFKTIIDRVKGKINTTVHLSCVTPASLPRPIVSWFKDGKELSGFKNGSHPLQLAISSTLQLARFSLHDVGKYQCLAYNSLLKKSVWSPDIFVSIEADKDAPYFFIFPFPLLATRNRDARFDCVILGNPRPTIAWMKASVSLSNSSKYNILSNGSLLLKRVDADESGLYTCIGSNVISSIQSLPVQLTVAYIDYDFIKNPQSQTAISGLRFMLDCQPPKSYPSKPTIKWHFEYQLIMMTERVTILSNNSLYVKNATVDDEGVYFCEATNTFTKESRTSKMANIIIHVKPTISITALSSVIKGSSLTINCTATGTPKPNVTIVTPDGTIMNTVSLFISSVKVSDAGVYRCLAKNLAGSSEKNTSIDVLVYPFITKTPQNESAVLKNTTSVQFVCQINGNPRPKISWYFKESVIIDTLYDVSLSGEILTIHNPSKENEGLYGCSGENILGKVSSKKATLKVFEPAMVISPTNSAGIVLQGNNISLACVVTGDPKPQVMWYHNQRLQSSNSSSKFINSTWMVTSAVHLHNVEYERQRGEYQCVGANRYGNGSRKVSLEVFVKPKITNLFVNTTYKVNDSLTVSCVAHGYPFIILRLLHNGSIIKQHTQLDQYIVSVNWTVVKVDSRHSGQYTCIAGNILGRRDKQNLSIIIKVPPGAPLMNITTLTSTSIEVRWTILFDGYSPITHLALELRDDIMKTWSAFNGYISQNKTSYIINGLIAFTVYGVRLRVSNEVGESPYSQIQSTKTYPTAPSTIIDLHVRNLTSRNFTLAWTRPSNIKGYISIFEILINNKTQNVTVEDNRRLLFDYAFLQLSPYTKYKLRIRAGTHYRGNILWGNSSTEVRTMTLSELPGDTVYSLNVTLRLSTSLRVDYLSPDPHKIYGHFEGYDILIQDEQNKTKTHQTTQTWFLFENLTPYTIYFIKIAVRNSKGIGNYSSGLHVRTQPSIPGKIDNIIATEINITTVKVSWDKPEFPNGPIIAYKVSIAQEEYIIIKLVTSISLHLRNLTSNTTYVIRVAAKTAAGFGQISDGVTFRTSENFIGVSTLLTTLKPLQTPSAARSWLDREYMVVIVGVSVFALFLLLTIIVVLVIRCHFADKISTKYSNKWELNPYYDSADAGAGGHIIGNKFTKRRSRSITSFNSNTTLHNPHQDDDLIWDDEAIDDLIEGSSIEPEYAIARTPVPPPPPPLPPRTTVSDQQRADYSSVDPYQGRMMELSPLVKLKGMRKNKRHPKIPIAVSPTNSQFQQYPMQEYDTRPNVRPSLSHQSSTSNTSSLSSSANSRHSQRSRRHTDSSSTSSLSNVDIHGMYREASKQRHRKQNKTTEKNENSNYAEITILPSGSLQNRDYEIDY